MAGPLEQLSLRDVTFSYPASTRPALSEVTLDLHSGEMLAIVGRNGSGKTTLAKQLCGIYQPDAGTVEWNGRPLSSLDLGTQVGVVFQTFARFWFSAAENIRVGDVDAPPDPAAVHRAAAAAGADRYLESLADGYDTPLAVEIEGGVDLSVGQWQRVAIARVLYRNPSLVVLDEPTASLDAEAEADLFDTLAGLRRDRTMVVISHRFSTVRSADRIVVMDSGRLIEEGTHDELMALGGRYATMYRVQASAYAEWDDAQAQANGSTADARKAEPAATSA